MPRSSSISSWTMRGIWNSIRDVRVAMNSFRLLLAVKLDDERFLDRRVDLLALRELQDLAGETVVVGLQPGGDGGGQVGRVPDHLLGRAAGRHRDDVVRLDLVARDVDPAAVDVEVAVADELPRLRPRRGEAESVDDVVEPRLEHPQQVLARDARPARGLRVVRPELLLEQPVIAA